MKGTLRRFLHWLLPRSPVISYLYYSWRSRTTSKHIRGRNNHIDLANAVLVRCKIEVIGDDNSIIIGRRSSMEQTTIRLLGNHLRLSVGEEVYIGPNSEIRMRDEHGTLEIGDHCTFIQTHFVVSEDHSQIRIGEDCMFAAETHVRCSDSHAIFDAETLERINLPANVEIENHVWSGLRCLILKGVTIGSGAVLGAGCVVTKSIPSQSVAVGNPAHVVRRGVCWTRERTLTYIVQTDANVPQGGAYE